jgi:catechol 2,3-dioxygenase-like lactoylglutathione lyase family enzyme
VDNLINEPLINEQPQETTMTWTFDHLAFNTADGQTLQDTFQAVLGLTPGRRPPFPFPGRWMYQDEQALVHVIEQPTFDETALSHIAFRTDEHATTVLRRVQASGLPYQVAQVPEDGIWQVFVQMPGGLVIELDAKAGNLESV